MSVRYRHVCNPSRIMDTSVTESVINVSETKSETEYRVSCSDRVRPSVEIQNKGFLSEPVFSGQADCTFAQIRLSYIPKASIWLLMGPPFCRPLGGTTCFLWDAGAYRTNQSRLLRHRHTSRGFSRNPPDTLVPSRTPVSFAWGL